MEEQQNKVLLQCVYCKEKSRNLKVLPCLHFCCNCCTTALSSYCSAYRCPVCDETISRSEFSSMPENFLTSENFLRTIYRGSNTCKVCGDELTTPVNHMQLAEFCDLCIKLHSKIMTPGSEREHAANESKSHGAKSEMLCKNHCKEALRYLCITCEEPICSECLILKHRRHQLSKIEEHGDVYRTQSAMLLSPSLFPAPVSLSRSWSLGHKMTYPSKKSETPSLELAMLEMKIKEKKRPVNKSLVEINGLKENLVLNSLNAKASVRRYAQSCKERLDLIEKGMLHEIETEASRKGLVLGEQSKTLQQTVDKLETALAFTNSVLQHASDTEVAVVRKHVMKRLHDLQEINVATTPQSNGLMRSEADLRRKFENMVVEDFNHI
eukprot:gene12051-2642_t